MRSTSAPTVSLRSSSASTGGEVSESSTASRTESVDDDVLLSFDWSCSSASISSEGSESSTASRTESVDDIHVVFVTLENAADEEFLEDMINHRQDYEEIKFSPETQLSKLRARAIEELCGWELGGEKQYSNLLDRLTVEIFTPEKHLPHTDDSKTLSSLNLTGDYKNPLLIFIVPHLSLPRNPDGSDPQLLWEKIRDTWFVKCTERGVAAFIACIRILFEEVQEDRCRIQNLKTVFLKYSLFPPAVHASAEIDKLGLSTESESPEELGPNAWPLAVLAIALQQMFIDLIPTFKDENYNCEYESYDFLVLEASRQIFQWLLQTAILVGSRSIITGGKFKTCQRLPIYFDETEWNELIGDTMVGYFKIIEPTQLDECLSESLPVITLSSNGYVSLYNREDQTCGHRHPYTWNSISGRQVLPENPGKFLSQELEPIIRQRQDDPSWVLDIWHPIGFSEPQEAVMICVDIGLNMSREMPVDLEQSANIPRQENDSSFTCLSEVKKGLKDLVSKISVSKLPAHLGLITFSGSANIFHKQRILSPVLQNPKNRLTSLSHSNDTSAIWDALIHAHRQLKIFKSKGRKNCKLRIIVLTYGEDDSYRYTSDYVRGALCRDEIILDAIVVRNEDYTDDTDELFRVAKFTGGYAILPSNRPALFQFCGLETLSDIKMRPRAVRRTTSELRKFWPIFEYKIDLQTILDFPPIIPHSNESDLFYSLHDSQTTSTDSSKRSYSTMDDESSIGVPVLAQSIMGMASSLRFIKGHGGPPRSAPRRDSTPNRFLLETRKAVENPHPSMGIYINESNINFRKVVMQGPPDSPYAGGTFILWIEMTEDFPQKPPNARFITPILHANITKGGRIYNPVFSHEWSPNMEIHEVLEHIWRLLMDIEGRDGANPLLPIRWYTNLEVGIRDAKNALKS